MAIPRSWRLWSAVALSTLFLGCSGTSESDMRKYAIRRSSDEDEETVAPATTADNPATPVESVDSRPAAEPESSTTASSTAPPVSAGGSATPAPTADPSRAAGSPSDAPQDSAVARNLTPEEAVTKTLANLQLIGEALERYAHERTVYPAAAITWNQQPMLSWRVELLPYLGYGELYDQFRRDEPWDGPHNKQLLSQIPDVYRLPNRPDFETNYLAVFGSVCAFNNPHGRTASEFEDGLYNTVQIVEADQAVPWTKPSEYELDGRDPKRGLGGLREGHFFVIWGGGTVGRVPQSVPTPQAVAMFTIAAGERFSASDVHQDPAAKLPSSAAVAAADSPPPTDTAPTPASSESPSAVLATDGTAPLEPATRQPVPSEADQQAPLTLFRELYSERYKSARTIQERAELAGEMLEHVNKLSAEPTAQFVLLNLTGQIAADSGDLTRARAASELLATTFEVSATAARAEIVRRMLPNTQARGDLLSLATECAEHAFTEDDFPLAQEMISAAVALSRREPAGRVGTDLTHLRRRIDQGERAYRDVKRALKQLELLPDSGLANRQIGEYYCLVKGDWRRGLPFLLKSDDAELATIARQESEPPVLPELQVELADAWWNYGERRAALQPACRERAQHWYQRVRETTDSGLPYVKAEVRLRELEQR